MCANFKPITREQIQVLGLPTIPFVYEEEVFPSFETPLLFQADNQLDWRSVNFGLIPKWASHKQDIKFTYNARNETLLEKRSFQESLLKFKFGVIPVTEFYEAKYINGRPQRWGVRRKDGCAFYIAALYEIAQIEQEVIRSACMITMDAKDHEMMKEFHEPGEVKRSVVIIPHERLMEWLNHKSTDIQTFLKGFPVEEYECFYCPKPSAHHHANQLSFL